MSETLAAQVLERLDLSAGEASLVAVVAAMVVAILFGLEQRVALFATIGGVIALLLSASGPV